MKLRVKEKEKPTISEPKERAKITTSVTAKPSTVVADVGPSKILKSKKKEMSILSGKSIDETYKDKELRQHIYDTPDTYAGSIDSTTEMMWVVNKDTGLMEEKKITFVEAFYKIFDEILVNAIDHHHRVNEKLKAAVNAAKTEKDKEEIKRKIKPVKTLKVNLDRETGWITVENDGDGIDVAKHSKKNIYVPEMLFGNLLTSINYDPTEERTVGGKNGYGAKLANILSKKFIVETVDGNRKLKFYQEYSENMTHSTEPKIEKYNKVPFTRIQYLPDYERFGITDHTKIDDWELLARRVYDASACTDRRCTIHLNDKKIAVKSFEDYVSLFIGNKKETKRLYVAPNPRWEVIVCLSPQAEFKQISFVNGIFTDRGGKHVNHVVDNLSKKISTKINAKRQSNEKKKKEMVEISSATVKKNIWVFIKSTIVNPNFDTQTKRFLTTLVGKFGSRCDFDEDFVQKASKHLGIAQRAIDLAEFKAKKILNSKTDGKRVRKVNHAKLVNAKYAGSARSAKTILVLTEGDSAAKFFKSGIKGLAEGERDYWGCFPLRGKLLNVKRATIKKLADNEEIMWIKKIMGLSTSETYIDGVNKLNYGKIMILADADHDGDHIKGLIINFIETYWPDLLKQDNFICSFATPIVKSWPEKLGDEPDPSKTKKFYSEKAYKEFAATHGSGWRHDYYKGLGTHSTDEARDCFKNMMITNYIWGDDQMKYNGIDVNSSTHAVRLAFTKKFEDDRKKWLLDYDQQEHEDPPYDLPEETVADFINKKMIVFSKADNIRSIPRMIDGLKPSQRKVVYTVFKKKYKKKVKVVQLAGEMLGETAYHHGEASAHETIIGLAANYVGSCNCNLLQPLGQYGSRAMKGKDHAQPRYIGTNKTPYLDLIFNEHDRPLVNQLYDDGKKIEPEYYVPIFPLVLANGAEGIGTGWSTCVPCYKVQDIVDNLKRKIKGEAMVKMMPHYRGYNGTIHELSKNKYITVGNWVKMGKNRIRINELPVGNKNCKSFVDYKEFIFGLLEGKKGDKKKDDTKSVRSGFGGESVLDDVEIYAETDTKLGVDLFFKEGVLDRELASTNNSRDESTNGYKFEKKIKVATAFSTTNMHLYHNGVIKKYESPEEIIDDFYDIRLDFYDKRKQYMLNELNHKLALNSAKYRFMVEIMEDKINIYKKKKDQIIQILDGTAAEVAADPAYPKFRSKATDEEGKETYEYLLSMRVDSFSYEKLEKLKRDIEHLENTIKELQAKTLRNMWLADLDQFLKVYNEETEKWLKKNMIDVIAPRKQISIVKTKVSTSIITKNDDDNMSINSSLDEVSEDKDQKVVALKKKLLTAKPKQAINAKPKFTITRKK